MSGHDHVIDCIAWAGQDAARVIEGSNYSGGNLGSFVEGNDGLNDENGINEQEESKESGESAQLIDDSRANL